MPLFGKITISNPSLPTAETPDGRINIDSFSVQVMNEVSIGAVSAGGGAGKAKAAALKVTRPVGAASALFFDLLVRGGHLESFVIEEVVRAPKGKNTVRRSYTFATVLVSDQRQFEQDGRLVEELELVYGKVEIMDAVANTTVSWNFTTNTAT